MRKVPALLLCGIIAFSMLQTGSAKADSKKIVGSPKLAVLVDGRKVKFQGGDPVSENGRVQVPLRGIGEALGAKVAFSGKSVSYQKAGKSIELTLGSREAAVDGKIVTMDAEAKAVKGRTYVPLRFVSENLGEAVSWDQVGNWVWIGNQKVPDITEVTKLQKIESYKNYFHGAEDMLVAIDKKFTDVRVVSHETMPTYFKEITFLNMWMVTDSENYGVRVRYKGPKKLVMYFLSGNGDIRSRTGHIIEQSDGTKIAQFRIKSPGDNVIYQDKNWKNYSIKNIDYFFFPPYLEDDSIHLISNPFK
ncbi:stalk domain-containing protein [Paenibacillus puldeungensis]|uniref:Stalk domain-containing protein n=1 Tax=Paenibacillus puldeungensis TaxID=696536 RepID=A0ABW3S2U4_9BACL